MGVLRFFNVGGTATVDPLPTSLTPTSVLQGDGAGGWQQVETASLREYTEADAEVSAPITDGNGDTVINHTLTNVLRYEILDDQGNAANAAIDHRPASNRITIFGGLPAGYSVKIYSINGNVPVVNGGVITDILQLDWSNVVEYASLALGQASGDKVFLVQESNNDNLLARHLVFNI